jgi:aminoglycoside phosphotransferase (APT) family kinase protein
MESTDLLRALRDAGLIDADDVTVTPLTGGVSSDIRLVETPTTRFVVKRALTKLRVKDDWYADPSRNAYEQAYMRYVGAIAPGAVPRILWSDGDAGLFVMEYLEGYANWKEELLAGRVHPAYAATAGRVLGQIHRTSRGDADAAAAFDTTRNFYELRLEPYLLTTAQRHPALAGELEAEAARIAATRLCLVHGDFSPKNMLVQDERLVLLDCEVAWYGEPAFDAAFLLNHFLLKALHFAAAPEPYLDLVPTFWQAYQDALGDAYTPDLEARVARLLPMLLLARIDGKSPAEYIVDPARKALVRTFVPAVLRGQESTLAGLVGEWRAALARAGIED